jgi:hypothetical protein
MPKDLLGRDMTELETRLLDLYGQLKELSSQDLDPCVDANVRAATAAMWNAVNDLALEHEHLVDLGI